MAPAWLATSSAPPILGIFSRPSHSTRNQLSYSGANSRRAMVRVCSERPHSSTSDIRCPGAGVSSERVSGTSAARCSRGIASLPTVTRSWYPSARAGPFGPDLPPVSRGSSLGTGRPHQSQVPNRVELDHRPGVGGLDDGVGAVGARPHVHHHVVDRRRRRGRRRAGRPAGPGRVGRGWTRSTGCPPSAGGPRRPPARPASSAPSSRDLSRWRRPTGRERPGTARRL